MPMKSTLRFPAGLCAVLLVCFFCSVAVVHAADVSAPAAAPFYANGEFWTGLFAAVASLVAIWQNKQASTGRKINESLVLAIEEATQFPEVVAAEKRVKDLIRQKALNAGVQPILHRLVKDLTEGEESDLRQP